MINNKVCPVCGNGFYAENWNRKYCSKDCAKESYKQHSIKKCKQCGKEFKPEHWNIKYCSAECKKKATQRLQKEWYKKYKGKRKTYPCSGYSVTYIYRIPDEMCLNCNSERCRFDHD